MSHPGQGSSSSPATPPLCRPHSLEVGPDPLLLAVELLDGEELRELTRMLAIQHRRRELGLGRGTPEGTAPVAAVGLPGDRDRRPKPRRRRWLAFSFAVFLVGGALASQRWLPPLRAEPRHPAARVAAPTVTVATTTTPIAERPLGAAAMPSPAAVTPSSSAAPAPAATSTLPPRPGLPGSLNISSVPAGATLLLDGKSLAQHTPARLDQLTPRRLHTLRLRRRGYEDAAVRFRLDPGEPLTLDVVLARLRAAPHRLPLLDVRPAPRSDPSSPKTVPHGSI